MRVQLLEREDELYSFLVQASVEADESEVDYIGSCFHVNVWWMPRLCEIFDLVDPALMNDERAFMYENDYKERFCKKYECEYEDCTMSSGDSDDDDELRTAECGEPVLRCQVNTSIRR